MSKTPPNTVTSTGAEPGAILMGVHANGNRGMLVQIFERQDPGYGGRIRGPFRILHEGKGKYSTGIRTVIDRSQFFGRTDDFFALVNREPGCGDCTHVLNANALWLFDPDLIYERIVSVEIDEDRSDFVKRCLSCGNIYTDVSLNFCLTDGTALSTENAEIETVLSPSRNATREAKPEFDGGGGFGRRRRLVPEQAYEYIRRAVAKHDNLELEVFEGANHKIMKRDYNGSIWIVPRRGGVSITVNGPSAGQLYREMERILGPSHRVDRKGYHYFQANDPNDVDLIIGIWSKQ